MQLLNMFLLALKNDEMFLIISDWIEEHNSEHKELLFYLKRLRRRGFVTFTLVVDCIAKFGTPAERHLIWKLVNKILDLNTGKRSTQRKCMRKRLYFRFFSDRLLSVWKSETDNLMFA